MMKEINYSAYPIYSYSPSDIIQRYAQNNCFGEGYPLIEADCGKVIHPSTFRVEVKPSGKPLSLFIVQHQFSSHFQASVLNSFVGETMLFEENMPANKRYVNKSRLLQARFLNVPRDIQVAIGRCNEVLQLIDDLPSNFANVRLFALVEKRFRMLQNLLVAEMYCQDRPAFRGANLIGTWMPYAERLENPTLETIALVFADMFKADSTLRSKLEVMDTLYKFE